MMKLNNSKAAYIAGIIDGEGHIGIHKRKSKFGQQTYRCRVQIEMTNKSLLCWIQDVTKMGRINKRPIRNKNWKQEYNFALREKEIKPFLNGIKKFLRIKRQQADTVLDFHSTLFRPGVKGHTQETMRMKHIAFRKMRWLNKRGVRVSNLLLAVKTWH